MISYVKPVQGFIPVEGEPTSKEFYQENEWRFVPVTPNTRSWLPEADFRNSELLNEHNKATWNHARLKFTSADVRYVFVKSDAEIPGFVDFIQSELDHIPAIELKKLVTRVISLDSIRDDM